MSREEDSEVSFWHQAQFCLADWPFFHVAVFLWKLEKKKIYSLFWGRQGMKSFDPSANIRTFLSALKYGRTHLIYSPLV